MAQVAVESGGGAVFQGDISAGRDITINHITEIRQVTEHLYNRSGAVEDVSDQLLGRLDVLNMTAELVEEYAKDVQASVPPDEPRLQIIFRECASILSDLRRLGALIEADGNGNSSDSTRHPSFSINEEIMDVRSRLMSLQFNLSHVHNRKKAEERAKDNDTIKKVVTELMNGPANADDTSSIRTFYTASSIPYVERKMWGEVERALRSRFTVEFVRDNYALIVATVEETVWEKTTFESVDIVRVNTAGSFESLDTTPPESASSYDYFRGSRRGGADKTGRSWASSVDDHDGERLLTLDGGGVRSYSSVLIIQELINEIARYEDIFEKEFTFYPRKFDPRSLRPCHYFDKMYGTSTGGILAIALSRLRMTVPETIGAFRRLVTAMFTNSRSAIPLATKYNHRPFENTLEEMVQFYCKQHRSGTCNRTEQFPWESAEDHDTDPLCQTICLTSDAPATGISEAYLLRTYDHTYFQAPSWVTQYNSGVADMSIGQVARATTATPFYFKPVQAFIGDPPVLTTLKDGGIRENNPSACAWMENASFHGNDARPSVLLSIGAGKFKPQSEGGSSSRTQQYAKRFAGFISVFLQAVEGEERHKVMRTLAGGDHTWYKRLNVTTGLENIKLDTWESGLWEPLGSDGRSKNYRGGKTMNRIQIATEAYLNDDAHLNEDAIGEISPREMLKQTAEKLVRSRRAREFEAMTEGGEKRERWETYMGKHLAGERDFFQEYLAQWDYALLGRKEQHD